MIQKLMDTTEMMTNLEYQLNAISIAANLTGTIIGMIKYNDELSVKTKIVLLERMIDLYIEHPIANKENIINECKKLLHELSQR